MFASVLYPNEAAAALPLVREEPGYFKDLNLDQMVCQIVRGRERYHLEPWFYTILQDQRTIIFRQDVLRDLKNEAVLQAARGFSRRITEIADALKETAKALSSADSYANNYLTRGRHLNLALSYIRSIGELRGALSAVRSEGLLSLRGYLDALTQSEAYRGMCERVERLYRNFGTVEYCMLIKDGTIRVRKYEGEANESEKLLELFSKFKQKDSAGLRQKRPEVPQAEHVEAAVLTMLAKWYPAFFADLADFSAAYLQFMDPCLERFANEVQFYLGYLAYVDVIRCDELRMCYPALTRDRGQLYAAGMYDLVLARNTAGRQVPVVNDFQLDAPERVLVITGPNQGGKTTFARAIGQLHHLALLGLSIPCASARLLLCDQIFSHFGHEEDPASGNGQLLADLKRLKPILACATEFSLIVINEIFTSTTAADASRLGVRMMRRILEAGSLAVCVTFLDELSSLGPQTVSMMSTVDPDDASIRTYRIIRKPADGLAYALHIAQKHRLTYGQVMGRLQA